MVNYSRAAVVRWRAIREAAQRRAADYYVHPDSHVSSHVTIGRGTRINGPALLVGRKDAPVRIGRYCAIAHGLHVRARNHRLDHLNLQDEFQRVHGFPVLEDTRGPITIGHNVWIADNVTVLPGVTIGNGAVIGAATVVTKDVRPYAVAVGNPAREVRRRFPDQVCEEIDKICWWDWDEERIRRNHALFSQSLDGVTSVAALVVD